MIKIRDGKTTLLLGKAGENDKLAVVLREFYKLPADRPYSILLCVTHDPPTYPVRAVPERCSQCQKPMWTPSGLDFSRYFLLCCCCVPSSVLDAVWPNRSTSAGPMASHRTN